MEDLLEWRSKVDKFEAEFHKKYPLVTAEEFRLKDRSRDFLRWLNDGVIL
jgi:hypothetical protein